MSAFKQQNMTPVCVDLDGTLIAGDTLVTSALALLLRNPAYMLAMMFWLLCGRPCLKRQLARYSPLNAAKLPYRAEVLEYVQAQYALGHPIVLATGADQSIAGSVACHLGIFSQVFASDGRRNLSGESKSRELVRQFGRRGFVYLGNSRADLPVWRDSLEAVCVETQAWIVDRVRATGVPVHEIKCSKPTGWWTLLRFQRQS